MQERSRTGMRRYVGENLARGYSLEQIEQALIRNGYTEKKAKIIIADYANHLRIKGRAISNNILAAVVLCFMLASVISNFYFLNKIGARFTGMITRNETGIGRVTLCVNTRPELNISSCTAAANVSELYYCIVNASDSNWNYTLMELRFYDNTSLFNISKTSDFGAEINFTPRYPEDSGGYNSAGMRYSIELKASDGSGCSNENTTEILNLYIRKGCSVKVPPVLNNLSSNYTALRNTIWTLILNATDADYEDSIAYSVVETETNAFSFFEGSMSLNSTSGLLNISPTMRHVGVHVLNISARDNSSCLNNTAWQLVNITVPATNTPPFYIGGPQGMDYSRYEGPGTRVAYDIDNFFNDTEDFGCLSYRYEIVTCNMFYETDCRNILTIENSDRDPRECIPTHPVKTRTSNPNDIGSFSVYFYANDSISESEGIYAVFTIKDLPENPSVPPGGSVSSPSLGSGGTAPKIKRCEEKWYCTGWGECSDGFMSRNCTDLNNCHTSKYKPNSTMACRYIEHCYDGMQNYDEEGIDCGGECPQDCATCYDAIMNCHTFANGTVVCEEGIDCGGPCMPCSEEEKVEIPAEGDKPAPLSELRLRYYLAGAALILLLLLLLLLLRKKKEKGEKNKFGSRGPRELLMSLFRKKGKAGKAKSKVEHEKEGEEGEKPGRIKAAVMGLIEKLNRGKAEKSAPKEHIGETQAKLYHILKEIGKKDNGSIVKELSSVMKAWLKKQFDVDYEATYEELSSELKEKKREEIIKKRIEPFFSRLAELEYGGITPSSPEVKEMAAAAIKIIAGGRAERKQEKKSLRKGKGKRKAALAVLIIIALLASMLYLFNPEITGRIVEDNLPKEIIIGRQFDNYGVYSLKIDSGEISSLRLSGKITKETDAKVYLGGREKAFLVFDSSAYANVSRKRIKTDEAKEFTGEKGIDLKIDYNKGTPWDSNDDGIASKDSAIDITVKNSRFSWDAGNENLCTLWGITNKESAEYACYGSYGCCALMELAPERDSWDDTLYLNYGRYGAIEDNIVSAKIVYANYSLASDEPYSEIIESEAEEISASFEYDEIEFEDACIESCSIEMSGEYNLYIEVNRGELYLESASYTEKITRINNAPVFEEIPDILVEKNGKYTIDLNKYASDADNDKLSFSVKSLARFNITIEGGIATIRPENDFEGKGYTFFIANDSKAIAVSNMVEIGAEQITEKTVQGEAKVGEPVKWIKRVKIEDNLGNTISLDYKPINVTVRAIAGEKESEVDESRVNIRVGGEALSLEEYAGRGRREESRRPRAGVQSAASEGEKTEVTVEIVEETAEEIEIEYYTEPPLAEEDAISDYQKRITISSDVHYENIVAGTHIEEKPLDSIKLYNIKHSIREEVSFEAFDTNNNGLIDYIEWVVPHLSEEIYEVVITVLNVQSYPMVGGEWEVRFTTFGKADLIIGAVNDTYYGTVLPDDLAPYELRCGGDILEYLWEGGNNVVYYNYECNETGSWAVKVLTPGVHNQRFGFGGAEAYASNLASVKSGETNLTIWDDTDTNSSLTATNMINFYANYTNGTEIANGTCTIKFNFTGDWQNEANMTFTSSGLPWNYSRTIPYKGTTYFNVLCSNESMETLNATDDIYISDSAPNFLPFGTIYVTEDTPYTFNFSHNVSDPDLNDYFTYGYKAPPGLPVDLWDEENIVTGAIDIYATHSNQNGTYNLSLIVADSPPDSLEGIGKVTIIISSINDYPAITQPPSNSMSNATVDIIYTYQVIATDEEDSSISVFNFSIVWCNRSYVENCNGVSIAMNKTTGWFNFTPLHNDAGNYTLNISAADSAGATTWKLANFTILDVNAAPVFDYVCNDSRTAVEDFPFNCTINATDPNYNSLTFSTNTTWFNLETVSTTEVLANFTPLNMHAGNYTINITVSDQYMSASVLINFTVNNSNDEPWLYNIPNQTAVVGLEYSYYVAAYDDDFWQPYNAFHADSENLTFSINNSWLSISKYNATAGYINFTPIESQKGDYVIMANVTDMLNASGNITFNITIRNNTAPVFSWICNDSRVIQEEVLFECHVNATDLEGDNFTFSVNTSWFLVNAASGNASFTVNDSEVGNHTIEFTVTDMWGWASTQLTNFTVNNTPEAPVFNGVINMTATQNLLFTYDLSRNASDEDQNTPEGDILHYYVNYSLPSGSLTVNETTGLINFTPQNIDAGSYIINFTVNDSYGLSGSVLVNFTVINVNDAPEFDYVCNDSRTAVEDFPFNCTINATDIDGDNLTISANASWFTIIHLSNFESLANFTPLNEHVGEHTINISVSDGQAGTYILINFIVNNTNDAPYFVGLADMAATEDAPFNYTLIAADDDTLTPDGDILTYASNSTLFAVNNATGYFNFTPNASQVGNYTIRFNVTDSAGAYNETIITFTISAFNDAPVLDLIPNFIVDEGDYFYYDVNATDEEDGNDTAGALAFAWNHTQGWFELDAVYGYINFTANSTMNGTHTLNISVSDTEGSEGWQLFNITIREKDFKPNITMIMPYGMGGATIFAFIDRNQFPDNITAISLAENTTIIFNHTSTDANGDILSSNWYKDNSLVYSSTNTSYGYVLGFTEAGKHNLTLVVEDGREMNDSFTWNITVNNTNRMPIFGLVEHNSYSDFSAGAENLANITTGGIILAVNAADYYAYGEYNSPSINLKELFTSFYSPIGFTNISWSAAAPAGTNVTAQTRTSHNNRDWGNWSVISLGRSYEDSAGEQIVSENATYIQYKLILQTTDTSVTPNVTNVRINYIMPDITLTQGDMNPSWVDLDNYFRDLDTDDTLEFSVSNISIVNVSINTVSNVVSITASEDSYGTEVIFFTANDSYDAVASNNITITVENAVTQAAVEYVYVTTTKTVIKTRTRTITQPRYLELLTPGHLSVFSEDTVVAPIILKNNGESVLNGIKLTADTDTDAVSMWFAESTFDRLEPDESKRTNLFIKWQGTIDEFDIIVNATSTDPEFTDSAVISVTGMSRVESNVSIEESHIEFVRDLLNNNPECLELTELLFEAEKAFDTGDYTKSRNTLNFVIEGCRYLITAKKETEQPTPIRQREGDLFKLISGILLLLLFIALIIIIALINRERKLSD